MARKGVQHLGTKDGITSIAADVGYESEAAFKRVTGVTPGRWREEGGGPATV